MHLRLIERNIGGNVWPVMTRDALSEKQTSDTLGLEDVYRRISSTIWLSFVRAELTRGTHDIGCARCQRPPEGQHNCCLSMSSKSNFLETLSFFSGLYATRITVKRRTDFVPNIFKIDHKYWTDGTDDS